MPRAGRRDGTGAYLGKLMSRREVCKGESAHTRSNPSRRLLKKDTHRQKKKLAKRPHGRGGMSKEGRLRKTLFTSRTQKKGTQYDRPLALRRQMRENTTKKKKRVCFVGWEKDDCKEKNVKK